ncbi:hypothetical protein PENSPDRAFT_672050 [Peniophora sp. CONT]|nr:hypothetical protein PENSPDRAFT_672050 [Peniophora sp. CONT]
MSSDYAYESFDSDTLRQLDQLEEAGFGLAAEPGGLQNLAAGAFHSQSRAIEFWLTTHKQVMSLRCQKTQEGLAALKFANSRNSAATTEAPLRSLSIRKAGTSTAEAAAHLDLGAVHSETSAGQESGEEEGGDVAGLMAEPGGTQGSSGSYDQQAVYMQSLQPSQGHSSNEDREPVRVSQVTSHEDSIDEYERNSFLVSDDISEVEDGQDSG